jgi:hypothetical protein
MVSAWQGERDANSVPPRTSSRTAISNGTNTPYRKYMRRKDLKYAWVDTYRTRITTPSPEIRDLLEQFSRLHFAS